MPYKTVKIIKAPKASLVSINKYDSKVKEHNNVEINNVLDFPIIYESFIHKGITNNPAKKYKNSILLEISPKSKTCLARYIYVAAEIDEALLHKNSIANVLFKGLLYFKINGKSVNFGKLVPSAFLLSGII